MIAVAVAEGVGWGMLRAPVIAPADRTIRPPVTPENVWLSVITPDAVSVPESSPEFIDIRPGLPTTFPGTPVPNSCAVLPRYRAPWDSWETCPFSWLATPEKYGFP